MLSESFRAGSTIVKRRRDFRIIVGREKIV
jgi:hypothetical protein